MFLAEPGFNPRLVYINQAISRLDHVVVETHVVADRLLTILRGRFVRHGLFLAGLMVGSAFRVLMAMIFASGLTLFAVRLEEKEPRK